MIYLLSTEFVAVTTELDSDFISIVWKRVTDARHCPVTAFLVLCPPAHCVTGFGVRQPTSGCCFVFKSWFHPNWICIFWSQAISAVQSLWACEGVIPEPTVTPRSLCKRGWQWQTSDHGLVRAVKLQRAQDWITGSCHLFKVFFLLS